MDTHTSYPPSIFINVSVAENFMCSICLEIADPEQAIEHIDCGRIFCDYCITTWKAKSNECPSCKQALKSTRKIKTENKLVYSMLSSLQSKCSSQLNGNSECVWKGDLGNYALHLKKCPEEIIKCPTNCGVQVKRKDLTAHNNVCEKGVGTCLHCKSDINKSILARHQLLCISNPQRQYECGYKHSGCQYIGSDKDMKNHLFQDISEHLKMYEKLLKETEMLQNDVKILRKEKDYYQTIETKQSPFFQKCVNNHVLAETLSHSSLLRCNICGRHVEAKECDWRCGACDWDCCEQCHTLRESSLRCPRDSNHCLIYSLYPFSGECISCKRYINGDERKLVCVYCNVRKCINCHYSNKK